MTFRGQPSLRAAPPARRRPRVLPAACSSSESAPRRAARRPRLRGARPPVRRRSGRAPAYLRSPVMEAGRVRNGSVRRRRRRRRTYRRAQYWRGGGPGEAERASGSRGAVRLPYRACRSSGRPRRVAADSVGLPVFRGRPDRRAAGLSGRRAVSCGRRSLSPRHPPGVVSHADAGSGEDGRVEPAARPHLPSDRRGGRTATSSTARQIRTHGDVPALHTWVWDAA